MSSSYSAKLTTKFTVVCHRIVDLTSCEILAEHAKRYKAMAKNRDMVLPRTGIRSNFTKLISYLRDTPGIITRYSTKNHVPADPTAATFKHAVKYFNSALVLCQNLGIFCGQYCRYFWSLSAKSHGISE